MSTPIYTPDPFEGLNKTLMQLLVAKQQREAMEEDLKLRKAKLKQDMEEYQTKQKVEEYERQKAAGPQIAAQQMMQNLLQRAAVGVNMGVGMNAGGMQQPLAPPTPELAAYGQMQGLPQAVQQGAAPGLLQAHQKRAEDIKQKQEIDRYLKQVRDVMTPEEYTRFESGLGFIQNGVDHATVQGLMPLNELDKARRVQINYENQKSQDERQNDMRAAPELERIGIHIPVNADGAAPGAAKMLQDVLKSDRAHAQAMRQSGAQAEQSIRTGYITSEAFKRAQSTAQAYKTINDASIKADPDGASDTAMAYAFIRMQDDTSVREGERKDIAKFGSVEDRISARFGKWKQGTLFTDDQRRQLSDAAKGIADAQHAILKGFMEFNRRGAEAAGVDPTLVIQDPYESVFKEGLPGGTPKAGISDSDAEKRRKKALGLGGK